MFGDAGIIVFLSPQNVLDDFKKKLAELRKKSSADGGAGAGDQKEDESPTS